MSKVNKVMMKNILLTSILITLLSACTSSREYKVTYYLLTPYSAQAEPFEVLHQQVEASKKIALYLQDVRLPQYLKQMQLVMLKSDNQLHFSRYHLWAENIEQSIRKSLKQALTQVVWLNQSMNIETSNPVNLVIEIDDFYPTIQGKVVLTGRYWLQNSDLNKQVNFTFVEPLQQDGFAASVKQMHALLELLAIDIEQSLSLFINNTSNNAQNNSSYDCGGNNSAPQYLQYCASLS